MKKNACSTVCNYFFVYLPVILLTSLISLVYMSYIFTYLYHLLTADTSLPEDMFFLHHTTKLSHAYTKGVVLLCFSLLFTIMLLMSMAMTVFTNPGYFPSPLELEFKIIKRNEQLNLKDVTLNKAKQKEDANFLTKFASKLQEQPLTSSERSNLERKLRLNYQDKMREDPLHMKFSNEEIIDANKKEYMEQTETLPSQAHSNSHNEHNHSYNNNEMYLEIYKGVDLTKMTLCGTCLRIKVERSHHCSQCQKCVLKMDHHCPWLANCIGFGNLKSFILLQFYGMLSCLLVAFSYWESVVNYNMDFHTNVAQCWFSLTIYLINIGLFAFLMWLCLVNWTNLFNGMTVIENSERKRFPSTKMNNIYDMGAYRNFTNVFGTNPLVWFIPFFANKNGSGYVFETNTNGFKIR